MSPASLAGLSLCLDEIRAMYPNQPIGFMRAPGQLTGFYIDGPTVAHQS